MPSGIDAFELLARGGAVACFAGLGLSIARPPLTPARLTGLLFFAAAAAHAVTQHPTLRAALGPAWLPAWVLSVSAAGLLWAFATELFEDRAELAAHRFAPAALLLVIGILGLNLPMPGAAAAWLAHKLVGGALMVHALVTIWTGWRNDLVETRRNLRGPILAAGALYAFAVLAVEAVELFRGPAGKLSPLAAGSLLLLGLAGIGALLRVDPDLFAAASKPRATPTLADAAPALSDDETQAAAALERLMRQDRLYRDEALTIAGLATKLGLPEYRLRRLINQRLGYRNFRAYLNRWRLGEATDALSDPAQREVSISTIALDAGFSSLGPFNRAFKAEIGMTPTEFRNRALAGGTSAERGSARNSQA